jgi:hypothetical protein
MATKTYAYIVSLQKQTSRPVTITSVLLVILACILQIAAIFYMKNQPIVAGGVVAFMLVLTVYENFWQKKHYPIHRWPLLVAAIFFMIPPISQFWLGVLYIVAAITEQLVQKSLEIGVDEDGLLLNGFPKKLWKWQELQNVILKDGILTIDAKNNSLFQRAVEDEDDAFLVTEFNHYCQQQLEKNK